MIKEKKFTNGYYELEINNWNDLTNVISTLDKRSTLVYRGEETLEYQLKSTFNRQNKFSDSTSTLLSKHLENFKNEIRGRINIPNYYSSSDDEMWAIGQHHGLATPLLDWTYSAYVALYFAFYKKSSKDSAVLYILNLDAIEHDLLIEIDKYTDLMPSVVHKNLNDISNINYIEHGKPSYAQTILDVYNKVLKAPLETEKFCLEIVDEILYSCVKIVLPKSGENQRLINQRGLFTLTKCVENLDEIIQERFNNTISQVLIKIKIDSSLQIELLQHLYAMNIHHSTLFPDLGGAAIFCNSKLSNIIHTETDNKTIEVCSKEKEYKVKDIKFLIDSVYEEIEMNMSRLDTLAVNTKWDGLYRELDGITNGEYIYATYYIFKNIIGHFPFKKLELYHGLILETILKSTKDLFLDELKDGYVSNEKKENFLNLHYALTGRESIRYTFDEASDEPIYEKITDIDEIFLEEWEEACEDIDLIEIGLIYDDFTFYEHFTHMAEQPYKPTEEEYRIAYEWLKGAYEDDISAGCFMSNGFIK